jgi:hypothetical protein
VNAPRYTRDQIKQLYEMHRRGAYLGREAEWARRREGRVIGTVDVEGK